MNISKLKEKIEEVELLNNLGTSDEEQTMVLAKFLYEESGGNLLQLILIIDAIKKDEYKKRELLLYRGLESAMHSFSRYSQNLEENKELNTLFDLYFGKEDGNIAFLIDIAKAYFPDGTYGGCSESGVYFFNKFKELLGKNKDKYLSGDCAEWAKSFGHYDYIKMVLEKDPK